MIESDVNFLKELGLSEYCLFVSIAPNIDKEDLQHRYGRHVFSGQGEDEDKIYIFGIMDICNREKIKNNKTPRQEDAAAKYAIKFLSFFDSIVKCGSL